MSELNGNIQQPVHEENSLNLSDVWHLIWDFRWWYVLSVALCLIAAFLYLYVTQSTFSRTAKIIINEDVQSNVMADLITMAGGPGTDSYSSNANNEAEAFASPDLMEKVVRRLSLETTYTEDQGIRQVERYKSSPVEMSIEDTLLSSAFSFRVVKTGDTSFRLEDFVAGPDKIRKTKIDGRLSEPVETPVGTVRLEPTLNIDDWDRDIMVVWANPMARAKSYSSRLTVTVTGKNSTVLAFTLTDRFPVRAERVLSTLIDVYNEEWITDKTRAARNTAEFITERIKVIEKELAGVETDLKQFKEENNLTDIQAMGQSYINELGEYSARNFEVRNQLSIAGYIRDYLIDPRNARALLPANSGLSSSSVESQIAEYNELYLEREKLIYNSSEDNPLLVEMTQSLDAVRTAILRSIDNLIATLKLQAEQIDSEENRVLSGMASSSGQEMELLSIQRQQQVKQSLYLYLLQKREENDIASLMNVGNTRLIVTPNGSSAPVSPNSMLVLFAAVIFGVFLPSCVLFLIRTLDNSVRTRDDISMLTSPFLAEIPLVHEGRKWRSLFFMSRKKRMQQGCSTRIMVEQGSRDMINEAFRVMRTNLDFMMGKGGDTKVILLSSFNPNSGKTFVSLNLAASFAVKGAKVALLDMDLRKGTLGKALGLKGHGLSLYLSGLSDDLSSITVNMKGTLDVLPVGALPPNPAELLISDRFRKLISELRSEYDYIFLDCPPIDIVADTSIIASAADMTIFIVRAGLMDKRALPMVEEISKSGVYPRMAIALNGIEPKERKYGYGRYGYGYGYGYRYESK